jgi:thiosulfate/3-mercaptopyruvate sulfurtransferase
MSVKGMRALCAAMLGLFAASVDAAETGPIIDTAGVKSAIARGALIWDVRAAPDYAKGHVPGAINIGDPSAVLRDPNTEDFLPTERIEKLLGAGGIDPSKDIVVYGARGTWNPYFAEYTVRSFGGTRVSVYHGGFQDWVAGGNEASTDAKKLPAVALKLARNASIAVETADVVKKLGKPGVQIVDVRTPKEFAGEDIRAIRGGHIPGAINIPYEENWIDPETPQKLARKEVKDNAGMGLKPLEQLKALYSKLDPNAETVVYCQSGARASLTATVLAQLGFKNVKLYDSSWLGYGNTLDAPAENVVMFNVGAMNGRMSGLQARIDELEKLVGELRAAKKN